MTDNELGDYLRARRESLTPADLGMPDDGRRRRVPGLRREEVAALAGISSEYYLRLEQGRERHPSEQVLAGIARALRLGASSEEFLYRIVRPLPDRGHEARQPSGDPGRLGAFVESLAEPAFLHDRVLEIIAANRQAAAISPAFRVGVNIIEAVFFDSELRRLYREPEEATARMISYLRAQAATAPLDPRLPALVADLTARSPRFSELWARHDVEATSTGVNHLDHPVMGRVSLQFERLCVAGTDHPVVVIYHAEPGSEDARRLEALLAGLDEPAAKLAEPAV